MIPLILGAVVGFGAKKVLDKSFGKANWNNAGKAPDSLRFDHQVIAFMRLIREAESNQTPRAYTLLNGGQDYPALTAGKHPGIIGKGGTTTASGAYQAVLKTWKEMSGLIGLGDNAVMTPVNQEKVALALLSWRGALPAVLAGDLEGAYKKLHNEWEGLPVAAGMAKKKGTQIDRARARKTFVSYGGVVAAGQ
jgi:muramidase (phage lysozyme)